MCKPCAVGYRSYRGTLNFTNVTLSKKDNYYYLTTIIICPLCFFSQRTFSLFAQMGGK